MSQSHNDSENKAFLRDKTRTPTCKSSLYSLVWGSAISFRRRIMTATHAKRQNSRIRKARDLPPVLTMSHFWSLKLNVRRGSCLLTRYEEHVVTRQSVTP
jgi:hypothetical protein